MEMILQDLQEWVAFLRSGEAKQTTKILEHNGEFCVLGTLCHLQQKKLKMEVTSYFGRKRYDGWLNGLPDKLQRHFVTLDLGPSVPFSLLSKDFLEKYYPKWNGVPRSTNLALLNDKGIPFLELSKIIPKVVTVIDNYKERNCIGLGHEFLQ